MPVGIRESSTGGERGGSCVSGQPLCSAARWRWETSQTSHSWTRNIKRTRTIENSPSADRKIVSATCQPACGLREASNKRSRLWTNGRAASQAPSIATTPARSRSLRVCHHQNQVMSLSRLYVVQTKMLNLGWRFEAARDVERVREQQEGLCASLADGGRVTCSGNQSHSCYHQEREGSPPVHHSSSPLPPNPAFSNQFWSRASYCCWQRLNFELALSPLPAQPAHR